ncbi:MAG TPA: cation:proton antiporter, partial [Myxococcota bacterium]|nr:cation:proton antiporter [Myxococcota bacterium]
MHSPTIEPALLVAGIVVVIAILATRLSVRLGIPALILFLGTGMLAGSEGIGGIWFDDPALTWMLGTGALAILLFSAGLDTHLDHIRPVLAPGLVLASVGVAVSTGLTAVFYSQVFDRPFGEGILLGAIVSSTDAAAVFGVLRSTGIHLRGRIQPLLEMESGSNDPVAIFLTLAA